MSASAALGDALAQKAARLERYVARAREERLAASDFATDYTHQDAAVIDRELDLLLRAAGLLVQRHLP